MQYAKTAEVMTPREIVEIALKCKTRGNVGIAYTYNEPLVGYEFVRDTARIAHENGLKNVLVTNGTAGEKVLEEITPFMDAMNIDLKAFTERFYHDLVKGDLEMVKAFIKEAEKLCHVELTTLIIPGKNDSEKEMHELAEWVSCLDGKIPGRQIPLHVTRFFPQFHMTDIAETPVNMVYRLAETAREYLEYVYVGNI